MCVDTKAALRGHLHIPKSSVCLFFLRCSGQRYSDLERGVVLDSWLSGLTLWVMLKRHLLGQGWGSFGRSVGSSCHLLCGPALSGRSVREAGPWTSSLEPSALSPQACCPRMVAPAEHRRAMFTARVSPAGLSEPSAVRSVLPVWR